MTVVQSVRHPAPLAPLALCILSPLSFPCQLVCHAVSASVISQSSVLSFSSFWLCNISCFLLSPACLLLAPHLATPTSIHVVPQLQSSLVFSQLASFSFECDYPKAVGKLRFALIDGHRRRVTPRLAGCMSLSRSLSSLSLCNLPLSTMSLSSSYRRRPAAAVAAGAGSLFAVLLTLARVWLKSSHMPHASRSHTHTHSHTHKNTYIVELLVSYVRPAAVVVPWGQAVLLF